jgi:putative salt-induced outer membrane protein
MNKKIVVAGFAVCLLLGAASVTKADDVPPATAPSAPADSDVVKDWGGNVALGLAVTQGNSKTLTANGAFAIEKLWKTDEWRAGVDGQYGVNNFGTNIGTNNNEVINTENAHAFADYKHLFNERLYGDLRLDGFHDDVADLQFRVNVGPAVGYYFIKSESSRLNAEVGPGYEIQRQDEHETQFFTLRVGERGEHVWGKQAKVWEEVTYLPKIDDFSTYLLISELGAEASINTHLALRVVFQDRYNSAPPPGKLPNDLAILASVVYKFGAAAK